MPSVSVILPNYNHAPFLRQRIDSILNQTFQDFELILLDDCSTDNSRDIIEGYRNHPKVPHVVFNSQNSGSAFQQWKKGIDLAQGEWLWIAESDDWAEPDFLEQMVTAADKHPNCVLVSSIPQYVFPDGRTWNRSVDNSEDRLSHGKDFIKQNLLTGNNLSNVSALLLRRNAIERIDFSRIATMRLCGDWMLYVKLCELGNVLEVNKTLSHFRQHPDSTSATAEKAGLPLTEGAEVLAYLADTFQFPSGAYAREWGRNWAKLERRHRFDAATKQQIIGKMRWFPRVKFWHRLYQIKLSL